MDHRLFFFSLTFLIVSCGNDTPEDLKKEAGEKERQRTVTYSKDATIILEFLASEKDGWSHTGEREDAGNLTVHKNEKGEYLLNDQWKITGVDDFGAITYDAGDESSTECISYSKLDNNTIEVYYWRNCDEVEETVVLYRISSMCGQFEERYGIGIKVFSFADGDAFDLFEQEDEEGMSVSDYPVTTIEIKSTEWGGVNPVSSDGKEWKMFAKYGEYDIYHALCFAHLNSYGYDLIGFSEGRKLCISQTIGKFYTWENYLIEVPLGIGRKSPESNPLRESPDEHSPSKEKKIIGQEYNFKVTEMQGYWVKVDVVEGNCGEGDVFESGWIRWRDNNDFLIWFGYVC